VTERILIAGVPKGGKTTLADAMAHAPVDVKHTDDLIEDQAWSEASQTVAAWLNAPGPWIIEGVAVPRAVRKWLVANGNGKPCDRIYWLGDPKVTLTDGQRTMAKGCQTVWQEVRGPLRARGVTIEEL
jgi:adenylate kinase family enzyme